MVVAPCPSFSRGGLCHPDRCQFILFTFFTLCLVVMGPYPSLLRVQYGALQDGSTPGKQMYISYTSCSQANRVALHFQLLLPDVPASSSSHCLMITSSLFW